MKTEMIAFSPSGLISLLMAVVLTCLAADSGAWPFLLIAASLLAYVREDVREGFRSGMWKRGWFVWTWVGPEQ